ncbi:MAG: V-type ATP synthase subunit D [Firmicutes bacterium]|nr:V-type ATP synthase subunit D [Bacillota bacterium]
MAERLTVNPTRMEIQRQRARLNTAKRGHKLLKDKSDEMVRHFMQIVRENVRLRKKIEGEISHALSLFIDARIHMNNTEIESAVTLSSTTFNFIPGTNNIMGLHVPKINEFEIHEVQSKPILKTSATFDKSVSNLSKLLSDIIHLAEVEKSCEMLAVEIIKIRRRINALEFILIPQINETIRFIRMKLAENERGQIVRAMKVKAKLKGK